MPGVNGGVIPTAGQIAIAQEISAALPMQDYESYYIIRESTSGATPAANAEPAGRGILLPEDILQLPDGRIGGPIQILVETDDPDFAITDVTEGHEAAGSVFVVFEHIDGQWLYDEMFLYCVGDCDWFWTEIADPNSTTVPTTHATPDSATPSTDAAWLQPIAPDECDVEPRSLEEVAEFIEDPGETVPRDYDIVGPADPVTAAEVSRADRVWHSCNLFEGAAERRAVESPRYIHQESPNAFANVSLEDQETTYRAMRHLSEEVISQDYLTYRIDSSATYQQELQAIRDDQAFVPPDMQGTLIVPGQVVTFADGRVGGPVSIVRNPFPEGFDPEASNDYWIIAFHIYSQDRAQNDAWVLDQRLDLCIGECDIVWTAYELESSTSAIENAVPATPSVATPGTDTASLQPIYPEECAVDPLSDDEIAAITQGSGDDIERSYAPTGPVDDALAQEVAAADRAWQSCYVYGTAGERTALQSARLTRDGPGQPPGSETSREAVMASLDQFDASRDLGDMMFTGDWRDYLVESDLFVDPVTGGVQSVPDFIPTIPVPEQAFHLTDVRIAIPIVTLVPPGTYPFSTEDVDDIPYGWIQVHILTQDPTRDDRWVMNEEITLCTGDCDVARAETVEYIDYLDTLASNSEDATPAATPQTRRERPLG